MSNQNKPLNDEELVQQLKQVYRDGYYSNNNTGTPTFEAHLYWFADYVKNKNILYAKSVIGEDEPIPEFGMMSEKKLNRIELRAEQRARIK